MGNSPPTTADAYLAGLPEDRRAVVARVREEILRNLPAGYQETARGMLTYEVPLDRYPRTYNKQPLMYAALAAQKNGYSLYLMSVYGDPAQEARLREAFQAAGKKPDMGKSCVRFKRLDDLPLPVVAEVIAATPVDRFIEIYEASRAGR
jgi:hypothetical protein